MIEARDTGSPRPDAGGAAGGDFWPAESPGRKKPAPRLLIGGAVALVLVVAAVVAALTLTGGEDEGPDGPARPVPTAYTPDFDGEGFRAIASRDVDKRPVAPGEVFPAGVKTVRSGAFTFTLAGSEIATDCKAATWGARLQADLAKFGCTQVMRAAYVSPDRKYTGQFIAINLASEEGVEQVLRDLDPATGAGWVLPFNPKGAPAFGAGFSAAYAKTYGHYAVITTVQRTGGAQPGSLNEMIEASLAIENPADFVWGRLDLVAPGQGRRP
ncbi:hypothetical protein [Spirillospora albida]|uniref:hypothetical protein n=1 Tax=Spirillospora albida TaxID=58123 RepID=UPI0004BF6F79|nr:hypothetical protein [Spirillospora albida]